MCLENSEPTEGTEGIPKQIPPSRVGRLEESQTRKHRPALRGELRGRNEILRDRRRDKGITDTV